jgi:hypothetical protein
MPVRRPREMNLGNRCRCDCGFVKRCKQRFERTGELDLDQRARFASRKRRQAVLQACQIESDLLAEEIGSGRQELAELDEAGSQLGKRRGEPLTRAPSCADGTAREGAGDTREGRGRGDGIQRKQRVVPREGQADPDEPSKVAGTLQQPGPGSERVRDAKPNGAQRRPP